MAHRGRLSAAENRAIWQYNTSLDYLLGTGVTKSAPRAFRWNRNAARSGYHDAVLAMGWFYCNGIGVSQNLRRARFWYRRAARASDPSAWFSLGQLAYEAGNYVEAATWFRKAVRRSHMRSSYYLARLYLDGRGVRQNITGAVKLLREAAQHGHPEARRLLRSKRLRSARKSNPPLQATRRTAPRA